MEPLFLEQYPDCPFCKARFFDCECPPLTIAPEITAKGDQNV